MSQIKSILGIFSFGSIFVLVGGIIFLIGADIIPVSEDEINAPRWVIMAAGMAFVLVGSLTIVLRLKQKFSNYPIFKWAYNGLLVAFAFVFAIPFNWIAFAPGDREFSGSVTLPLISIGGGGSEMGGRLAFGYGAVVMDIIFVVVLFRALQGRDLSDPNNS